MTSNRNLIGAFILGFTAIALGTFTSSIENPASASWW